MPLSTNNKTDGKVLRQLFDNAPLEQLQALTVGRASVLNDTEARLAKIISTFVGAPYESLHPESNIFELGLDSVSVLALSGKLRKSGFRNVSISQIMSSMSCSCSSFDHRG
jgi:aryl carrier-like protein